MLKLQQQLDEQKRAISEVEGGLFYTRPLCAPKKRSTANKNMMGAGLMYTIAEIRTLESNLTLQQIRNKEAKLRKGEMEDKLVKLREGVTLVRPEEREAIEEMYSEKLSQWRKRMFKDVWGVITENSPQDLKQFKEELGLEYDEEMLV
ncbi:hypothetical protein Peur_055135 [Populus x canadensis]